jgi:hypothetical protein
MLSSQVKMLFALKSTFVSVTGTESASVAKMSTTHTEIWIQNAKASKMSLSVGAVDQA